MNILRNLKETVKGKMRSNRQGSRESFAAGCRRRPKMWVDYRFGWVVEVSKGQF